MRKKADVTETGRSIPPEAYAWYVRALSAESHGRVSEARLSFAQALRADKKSAAAVAGLIRVSCADDEGFALSLVDWGARRADRPGLVWAAGARCMLHHDDRKRALRFAERALRAEPLHAGVNETLIAVVSKYEGTSEAQRYRRGYSLAVGESGSATDDGIRNDAVAPADRATVDHALWEGDLDQARRDAVGLFTPGALAARALGWGNEDLARAQAELVSAADPGDPDARLVLALLGRAVPLASTDTELSLVAVALLARELNRRVGRDAADEILDAFRNELSSSSDELVRSLAGPLLD